MFWMFNPTAIQTIHHNGALIQHLKIESGAPVPEEATEHMPTFGKRRALEWYLSRQLLSLHAEGQGETIPWNKIELHNFTRISGVKGFVSLSHTRDLVVLASAPFAVGIDVEDKSRKVPEAAADKFVNSSDEFGHQDLLKQWCAKEACFKALSGKAPKSLKEVVIKGDKFHYDNTMIGTYSFLNLNDHILALAKVESIIK